MLSAETAVLFSKGEDFLSLPGGRADEDNQDELVKLSQVIIAGESRQVDPISCHLLEELLILKINNRKLED